MSAPARGAPMMSARHIYGRGKGRSKRDGTMTAEEVKFAAELEARRVAGKILRYDYEPERLRLADKTYYVPDFRVVMPDEEIVFFEVKPRAIKKNAAGVRTGDTFHAEPNAKTKIKVAAEQHPYRFVVVYPRRVGDGGGFTEEEV